LKESPRQRQAQGGQAGGFYKGAPFHRNSHSGL
jgi:hypothetical protein